MLIGKKYLSTRNFRKIYTHSLFIKDCHKFIKDKFYFLNYLYY